MVFRMCMDDPQVGNYKLSGYLRSDYNSRLYLITMALAAKPVEHFLVKMLEDDRFFRHADGLWKGISSELQHLNELPASVYASLAALVSPYMKPSKMRTTVLSVATSSVAYLWRDSFECLQHYPWKITQGDIATNLQILTDIPAEEVQQLDLVTRNCRALLDSRYYFGDCKKAWELVTDVGNGVGLVEKAHGYGAKTILPHPQLGAQELHYLYENINEIALSPLLCMTKNKTEWFHYNTITNSIIWKH